MKLSVRIFLLIALLAIGGCASFSVTPLPLEDGHPEQVWQAKAIQLDPDVVSRSGKFSAVIVQAPESWVKGERSGVVSYGSNGVLIVNRDAWRAKAFFQDGSEMETSALLGSNNRLIVLLPGIDSDKARLARVLVFSGLGTFVLDSEGREYGGEKNFDACAFVERIRQENVLKSNSSAVVVANLSPETEKGGAFLKALYRKFSERKDFDGTIYLVASIPNIERATSGVSSPDDYVISNLDMFITPGMGVVGLAQGAVLTGYGMATAKPQGPYREAKPVISDDANSSSTLTPDQSGKIGDQ